MTACKPKGFFPTRYTSACFDPKVCPFRPCMWPGEDKGSYVVGQGYTSYHDEPKPVCSTRNNQGCPTPLPDLDLENARCCYRPDYRRAAAARKVVPCATCGETAPGWAAILLNTLPTQPGMLCKHPVEQRTDTYITGWTECGACRGAWDKYTVNPHESPTKTHEDVLNEFERRVKAVFAKIKETS